MKEINSKRFEAESVMSPWEIYCIRLQVYFEGDLNFTLGWFINYFNIHCWNKINKENN